MHSESPAAGTLSTTPFHDDVWEDLLNYIEEKRVIPIVGPELLKVQTESGPRLLLEWLAEKLAARLNVDPAPLAKPLTLNDVVCSYLTNHGRREEAYTRLRTIMREAAFSPPLPLRQLAEITDFNLYVSMTFDPLLEQAVNAVRFGGSANTEVIAYAPNRVADLPVERDDLQRPVVYHLLGRLSASPTYVISDEDMLEFVCALQSEHLTPEKLFHALEHNHLLVIGSDFSNWLARLFLRMTKRRRLSDPRDVGEILADSHSLKDVRLVSFLQQVSVRTRMFSGAEEFVAELHRRWMARRRGAPAGAAEPARFLPPAHQLCPRRPARRAEAQVRARRRRHHDLVRHGPAGERRRLRPQDPHQHRALLLLHPGRLRHHAAAPRGLFPPRVELCRGPHARHGRRRRVRPAHLP